MCPVKILLLALFSSLGLLGFVSFARDSRGCEESGDISGFNPVGLLNNFVSYMQLNTRTYIFLTLSVLLIHLYLFGLLNGIFEFTHIWPITKLSFT